MQGYAVVDVETTGFSPAWQDRVVEVAVVHVTSDGLVDGESCTLVNPGRDMGPQKVHGIAAADVLAARRRSARRGPTTAAANPAAPQAARDRLVSDINQQHGVRHEPGPHIPSGIRRRRRAGRRPDVRQPSACHAKRCVASRGEPPY